MKDEQQVGSLYGRNLNEQEGGKAELCGVCGDSDCKTPTDNPQEHCPPNCTCEAKPEAPAPQPEPICTCQAPGLFWDKDCPRDGSSLERESQPSRSIEEVAKEWYEQNVRLIIGDSYYLRVAGDGRLTEFKRASAADVLAAFYRYAREHGL